MRFLVPQGVVHLPDNGRTETLRERNPQVRDTVRNQEEGRPDLVPLMGLHGLGLQMVRRVIVRKGLELLAQLDYIDLRVLLLPAGNIWCLKQKRPIPFMKMGGPFFYESQTIHSA